MALNNEFKVKDNLNTLGKILSSGIDLFDIFATPNGGNADNWNSTYLTVYNLSSNWNSVFTTVNQNSAAFTLVQNNSANWDNAYTTARAGSADWDNAYTTARAGSARFESTFTTLCSNSANWYLTSSITSDVTAGAIVAAQVIPAGTSLQEFASLLLNKTFEPTFIDPSASVSNAAGTNVETGTTSITLTMTFASGAIVGTTINGVWFPNNNQNVRSGPLTGAIIYDSLYTAHTTQNTFAATSASVLIRDNANTYSVSALYATGPQPVNSKNQPFSTRLPAGRTIASITINGRRNLFLGAEAGPTTPPADSAAVRALPGTPVLNPAANTNYNLTIPVGTTRIVFAYPTGLGLANGGSGEPAFKDTTNNFDYTLQFGSPATVSVNGANGLLPTNYYVYTYVPAVPIPGAFNMRLII